MLGIHPPTADYCEKCKNQADVHIDEHNFCLTHGAQALSISPQELKDYLIERGILRVNIGGILITIRDLGKVYDEK